MCEKSQVEIWGGIEGTINRVRNTYHDQSEYSGHYTREGDIDLIASLGIKMLRYPVLWEKHQPQKDTIIDWSFTEKNLRRLKELHVEPIAGLVHHGSGPVFVNFFDGSFEQGVADYARLVAEKFPWLQYYTPINEPLTTARFCGMYGHWYPHLKGNLSFYRILLSECRATVMAMKAIREINPNARLIQTEDLGKVYSTPLLQYQADLENKRRWLSYDLLCGKVNDRHPLWDYLTKHTGLTEDELSYFTENPCIPDICGFNYYITSERYLDEDVSKYPDRYQGGNGHHRYADVETVRVPLTEESGPYVLFKEAYEHVQLPIAITECHLHCTREEQMRWFHEMWKTSLKLKSAGVDIRALTAWSMLGAYGWNNLVTEPWGTYEPGVFKLNSGSPKPTALAHLIQVLAKHQVCSHPVLQIEGWWKRETRILYPATNVVNMKVWKHMPACQPVLIVGESGSLGTAVSHICYERNIHHRLLSKSDVDITDPGAVERIIQELKPWAVIHAIEFVQSGEGEKAPGNYSASAYKASSVLSGACKKYHVKQMVFLSDLVSDCAKMSHHIETGKINLQHTLCQGRTVVEKCILQANPAALIIRTGNLFSPWDHANFITSILTSLKQGRRIRASNDVYISITYVPDLVHEALNLLLDNEQSVVHVTNAGKITWESLALKVAEMAGFNKSLIKSKPANAIREKEGESVYSVLRNETGILLPVWENALQRYFEAVANVYLSDAIAV